jgi:hypothetical protein
LTDPVIGTTMRPSGRVDAALAGGTFAMSFMPRLRYAEVSATLALVLATSGVAYLAGLPAHSVGTTQLKDGAVTTAKLHNLAVTRGKIANGAVDLAKIKGTDVSGTLSLSAIPANTCASLDTTVAGAALGQVPVLGFTGNVALPSNLIVLPIKVSSAGHVRMKVCNPTASASAATAGIGVRVITFG